MKKICHIQSTCGFQGAAVHMIKVHAPLSLPEGYNLVVRSENGVFHVTVPEGGVEEGQIFRVPYSESLLPTKERNIATGQWKDGLFSCLKLGLFHPSLCNAWCCPHLLMSQILSRMHMTWHFTSTDQRSGNIGSHEPSSISSSFPMFGSKRTFALFATLFVFDFFFAPPLLSFDTTVSGKEGSVDNNKDATAFLLKTLSESIVWNELIYGLISIPMTLYTFMVLVKLRAAVRAKYHIPSSISCCSFLFGRGCDQLEDYCCVFWCHCCTLAQLARQTANYEDEKATCCSRTGLPATSRTASPSRQPLLTRDADHDETTVIDIVTTPRFEACVVV